VDTSRYEAAVDRNLAEIQRALLNLELLKAMEAHGGISSNEAKGTYFALFNDYLSHCIKVLEDRGGAASFWYIYRTNQGPLDKAAKELNIDVAELQGMSEKLKHVRDKTHFHIDRDGVLDPKVIWRDADINGKALADVAVRTWALLNAAKLLLGHDRLELPKVDAAKVTRATAVLDGGE
jgi:hypothetical protein